VDGLFRYATGTKRGSCVFAYIAYEHDHLNMRPMTPARRLRSSCERICMPPLSDEDFLSAIRAAVRDNIAYVPPPGSNGSLYLRPLLFGSGARIGLQPADEYTFIVMVIPVGDYYKGGLSPVDSLVVTGYDRAAPRGVGNVKVAGNYAADMLPNMDSKEKGYPISLYLDALTQTNVEEFSTSNFIGIKNGPGGESEGGTYATPISGSVLPSITNKSLMTIVSSILVRLVMFWLSLHRVKLLWASILPLRTVLGER